MTVVMSYDQVRELLPQAYPMLLIDVVEELQPGERIVCRKNITGNEWMFPGHFPGQAIYPGVLLLEGMAQASILLAKAGNDVTERAATYLLAGAKVRYLKTVVPGDQVRYECEVIKMTSAGGIVSAVALVDGTAVAKADLTFAIRS